MKRCSKVLACILVAMLVLGSMPFTALKALAQSVSVLVEPSLVYERVYEFHDGMAMVGNEGKCGYVDATGSEAIPLQYDSAGNFSEGLAAVLMGDWETGKWGYIDKTGNQVIAPEYLYADDFSEGLAPVVKGDWETSKTGFIDKTGTEVIPFVYDYAQGFSEGLAAVSTDGKCGFIDKTGNVVVPLAYEDVRAFSEGLAVVRNNDKYGFVDSTGKEVIPLEYDWVGSFEDGMAMFEKGETYGLMDKDGKQLYSFDDYTYFREGLCALYDSNGDKMGVIDKNGKTVVNYIYDMIGDYSYGLAAAGLYDGQSTKFGFIDKRGTVVVPLEYDYVKDFSEGFAWVNKGDKWGIIYAEKPIEVIVNGSKLEFDVDPVSINDRTLVPLRAIFEALGVTVQWDEDTQTATGTKDGKVITLRINDAAATVDNQIVELDVPAMKINDRTLVPVRFIAQSIGANVEWDEATRTAYITTK